MSPNFEHVYELTYQLQLGDIVVDVGAYKGTFTTYAKQQGAKYVITIEPSPKTFYDLTQQLRVGAELVNKAAWYKECAMPFNERHAEQDNVCDRAVAYFMEENKLRPNCTVRCDTLDNICKDLPHVDFLKMDVEGSEIAALLGANVTLQKTRHVAIAIYPYDEHAQARNNELHIQCLERILQTYGFRTTVDRARKVLCGDK